MTTDLKPLCIWDTRGVESIWHQTMAEASSWAMKHIRDAIDTYRVEFYLLDAPYAIVYRYEREPGSTRLRYDPDTGEPVRLDPVTQMLDELPPAHLLAI